MIQHVLVLLDAILAPFVECLNTSPWICLPFRCLCHCNVLGLCQRVYKMIVESTSSSQSQQRTLGTDEHLPNPRTSLPQLQLYSKFGFLLSISSTTRLTSLNSSTCPDAIVIIVHNAAEVDADGLINPLVAVLHTPFCAQGTTRHTRHISLVWAVKASEGLLKEDQGLALPSQNLVAIATIRATTMWVEDLVTITRAGDVRLGKTSPSWFVLSTWAFLRTHVSSFGQDLPSVQPDC